MLMERRQALYDSTREREGELFNYAKASVWTCFNISSEFFIVTRTNLDAD